ncbi:restriction endonuclease subunit S [Treponema denticola]|uniref:restriction endonuclease subunit S n=1 Tax=Treponema denticola TaxID=158 RepID=UPI0020A39DC8|nr:restriction endonuclease subunit S [Treponema denticola]UTC83801.1 restriction endonuclease subunit S [Treponema denticola]
MNKIDEMLKNEKAEWKRLGEVALISGAGVDKKINHDEVPIKLLNYMDVYKNLYINKNTPNMEVTAPISKIEQCNIEYGDIFITPSSETEEDIFMSSVAKEIIENTVYSYHIMRIRLKFKNFTTSCYLNYLFRADIFRKEMRKKVFGNTRKTIAKSEIENLEIPIPSLQTQEKIVKILDTFTELQTELQTRIKQYSYYRDMLLSEKYLNKISEKIDGVENKGYKVRFTTLGDVGTFTRGNGLQKSDFIPQGKPVIHYGQIYTKFGFETKKTLSFVCDELFSKLKKAKPKDILIATTSENIEDVGKSVVWLGDEEIGFSGDMYSYTTNENSKYIAYYFQTVEFQKQKEKRVTGTKLIRIHGDDMEKFIIPLPPLELQNKVVQILDKFQSLVEDTKGLLPQEIEQRKKQYEYYREKLLTFFVKCDNCDSRQQTADSRQQTADSRQQTADSRQQTADSRQQTADSRQQTADSRQQTADSRQQTADS